MQEDNMRNSFFKYVFFNIVSTLGVSVYILIDTYFISKGMGADGLASLNLCLPVFNFINGFGLMLGMGGGSRFSMMYCRTERCETDKIFTNSFYAALAISAVFEVIGLFFPDSLPFFSVRTVRFLKCPEPTLKQFCCFHLHLFLTIFLSVSYAMTPLQN